MSTKKPFISEWKIRIKYFNIHVKITQERNQESSDQSGADGKRWRNGLKMRNVVANKISDIFSSACGSSRSAQEMSYYNGDEENKRPIPGEQEVALNKTHPCEEIQVDTIDARRTEKGHPENSKKRSRKRRLMSRFSAIFRKRSISFNLRKLKTIRIRYANGNGTKGSANRKIMRAGSRKKRSRQRRLMSSFSGMFRKSSSINFYLRKWRNIRIRYANANGTEGSANGKILRAGSRKKRPRKRVMSSFSGFFRKGSSIDFNLRKWKNIRTSYANANGTKGSANEKIARPGSRKKRSRKPLMSSFSGFFRKGSSIDFNLRKWKNITTGYANAKVPNGSANGNIYVVLKREARWSETHEAEGATSRLELCKKRILIGERCRPLNLSGQLHYDEEGILLPEET